MTQGLKRTATRFGRWLSYRWHKTCSKPVTFGALLHFSVKAMMVALVTIGPLMCTKQFSWDSGSDWAKALAIAWPIAIAAFILREVDRISEKRKTEAAQSDRDHRRRLWMATAISEIQQLTNDIEDDEVRIRHARETVLVCLMLRITGIIGESADHSVVVSLVDFGNGVTVDEMRISARSAKQRQTPVVYKRRQLVAWDAITKAGVRSVDDTREDLRFARLKKSYRTVIAVPIIRDGTRAVGAVSIDHPRPYVFYGRTAEIEEAVQPYLAVLLLTYRKDAVSFECEYDPSHSTPP